jgi:hypothetical protein
MIVFPAPGSSASKNRMRGKRMNELTGRKRFYEVNLDAARQTEGFDLSSGLTKEAYMRGTRVSSTG